ncbi:DNA-binding protein [Pseudomonas sp. ABY48]|uniref:helix-turn-helix domain-containing transcriptional regulator n=1 Tax=Pseudomonas sp. ABY48 TaxID=3402865 RepID=UPI003B428850
MTEKLKNYDFTAYLTNSDDLKVLFDDVLETGDANFIVNFLRMAVRARGVELVAKKIKELPDPMPDFLLGEDEPSFKTVLSVIQALEIDLGVRAAPST